MDECGFKSREASTAQGTQENDDFHEQLELAAAENLALEERELAQRSAALKELSPTIIALGRRLEQIRSAEVERYRTKLGTLEPSQRLAVEALTRGILNRMLRGLVRELKAHTGEPEHQMRLRLVRRVFGLA
jgi:glutamyl-tRNA reductase